MRARLRRHAGVLSRLPLFERVALAALTVAGGLNAVVFLVQGRAILLADYANADAASALVLPKLISGAPSGTVANLGDHAWYESWLVMRATVGLPGYRQLWEIAPFVLYFAGVVVLAWCALQVFGRIGAACTSVVLVSVGYWSRSFLFGPARDGVVLHAAVLCAVMLIVWRQASARTLTRRRALLIGAATVIFTAASATDPLETIGVIVPFAIAPLGYWCVARTPASRATALFALATGVLTIVGASIITHVMTGEHIVAQPFPLTFVAGSSLITALQGSIEAWTLVGDGNFYGTSANLTGWLTFAAAALCVAALAAVGGAAWGALRPLWTSPTRRTAAAPEGARALFVGFWGLALLIDFAAFTLTSLGAQSAPRYLLVAWIAVASMLGLVAVGTRLRALAVTAVVAFGLITAQEVIRTGEPVDGPGATIPTYAIAGQIERYLVAKHATLGFAGYWEAAPLSLRTRFHLTVAPVQMCSGYLCPFTISSLTSWYVPVPRTRTFLLTTTIEPLDEIAGPAFNLGHALSIAAFGPFTVYVYPYDIASRFTAPPPS